MSIFDGMGERMNATANLGKNNPLEVIEPFLREKWPELFEMKNVWVTGGTIWRPVYGLAISTAKDIDIVATSWWSFRKLRKLMERASNLPPLKNYMDGTKYLTLRGQADVWRGSSIKQILERFSGDKSNVRMAYSPYERRLIILPNGES